MEQKQFDFPTEVIELPSKGLLYDKDSPLATGKLTMKYMTAREEDILTNQNYLVNGTAVPKFLESLVVSKVNTDKLLVGDQEAVMVASRILGYGKDYTFTHGGEEHTIDLTQIEPKTIDENLFKSRENSFEFTANKTGHKITFKLLTVEDERKIQEEIAGLRKIKKGSSTTSSTTLKHTITSVNGDTSTKAIRQFVDTSFLVEDIRALRKYIGEISPGMDLQFYPDNGPDGGITIPIGYTFFWPDARV